MLDMRQIACPMCGRLVTVSGNEPVPCPSCGVPVSAPVAAELPASPLVADDDSATRVATIPASEPAPVGAPPIPVVAAVSPVVETPIPAVAPVPPVQPAPPVPAASDSTDPRTQPVPEAEVQQAAYPVAAESSPAATAAPELPVTQTYHGAPPQEPVTQAYQYPAAQQPATQPYTPVVAPTPQQGQSAPKRNLALIVIGVVVAVVLLLGIIGAAVVFASRIGLKTVAQPTPTAAATATATVPAGFLQFSDDGKVYSLNYPSGWTKSATSGDLNLAVFAGVAGKGPGVFEVEYIKATLDPKTLEDSFLKQLDATGKVTDRQGPTALALAGETWQRETTDITVGQSAQHVVVLATGHGTYTVLIAYLSSKDTFDGADTQDFQPMLSSFQFVK